LTTEGNIGTVQDDRLREQLWRVIDGR